MGFKKNSFLIGEILGKPDFDPFFDPPQKTPEIPKIAISDHFLDPKKPPKTPKPPKWPKFQKMALFDQICLFGQKLWRFDKQNPPFWPPLGDSPPPPKMALFDPPRENPQKPPILAIFGHFLVKIWGCEWISAPLARLPISNNRVIRPQIWNLRRKRGFFCTPPRCGKCEWSECWPQYFYYYQIYYLIIY